MVLQGWVDPQGGTISVWFEWGTDPNLQRYWITGTQTVQGAVMQTVTTTLTLPDRDSVGVPYYYRIAAGDPNNPVHGNIVRAMILLGKPGQGGVTDRPYWNKFDRLIHFYAYVSNLPAPVLKGILVHESNWAQDTNQKPEQTLLYELVSVDYQKIHKQGLTPTVPSSLTQYLLPGNPPPTYPYSL